uniref:RIN4 pathogenic type III effector avirulence factor Avr cleavage site domain-containing protein n=1 Tax=Tanacetum cinerariifolium TaxID=118510 RepID=A0A699ICH1_TANCI|nr:hypothetical protein [Tanacetum cinerariifolium]
MRFQSFNTVLTFSRAVNVYELLIKFVSVPKFGNWESDENVPYTVYFDSARKGKTGGKMINPNDLQETPKCLPTLEPHHHHRPLAPNPTPNQTSLSAKVDGKGSVFPAWEGKNSYDINHVTPGRSRMKPAKGDETLYFLLKIIWMHLMSSHERFSEGVHQEEVILKNYNYSYFLAKHQCILKDNLGVQSSCEGARIENQDHSTIDVAYKDVLSHIVA